MPPVATSTLNWEDDIWSILSTGTENEGNEEPAPVEFCETTTYIPTEQDRDETSPAASKSPTVLTFRIQRFCGVRSGGSACRSTFSFDPNKLGDNVTEEAFLDFVEECKIKTLAKGMQCTQIEKAKLRQLTENVTLKYNRPGSARHMDLLDCSIVQTLEFARQTTAGKYILDVWADIPREFADAWAKLGTKEALSIDPVIIAEHVRENEKQIAALWEKVTEQSGEIERQKLLEKRYPFTRGLFRIFDRLLNCLDYQIHMIDRRMSDLRHPHPRERRTPRMRTAPPPRFSPIWSSWLALIILAIGVDVFRRLRFRQGQCFADGKELRRAVQAYALDPSSSSDVAQKYGWPIGNWCTSEVTDFSRVFKYSPLNEDISAWDMSNARSLERMFYGARNFDKTLLWDVSKVKNFNGAFAGATSFQGKGLSSWNTESATSMHGIFDHAVSFNADISGWSTGLVKDMSAAFRDAVSFDCSLDWNVAKVKTFSRMFRGATQFKGKGLEHWDVSSAERADFMFEGAVEMSVDISDWDVSSIINLRGMFLDAISFKQNLCSWGRKLPRDADLKRLFDHAVSCPSRRVPTAGPFPSAFCFPCDSCMEED